MAEFVTSGFLEIDPKIPFAQIELMKICEKQNVVDKHVFEDITNSFDNFGNSINTGNKYYDATKI